MKYELRRWVFIFYLYLLAVYCGGVAAIPYSSSLTRRLPNSSEISCDSGAFVVDLSEHQEGIGSTFQHRKRSMILAAALNVPWVGALTNQHENSGTSHASFFGMNAGCTLSEVLRRPKQTKIDAHLLYAMPQFDVDAMCSKYQPALLRELVGVTDNTLIIVKPEDHSLHEDLNDCLFNDRFRERFWKVHAHEKTFPRKQMTVHFRWGDVETANVNCPDWRAGTSLAGFAHLVNSTREPGTTVTLVSEGSEAMFAQFLAIVPDAHLMIDATWEKSLLQMASSDVLMGGTSSFFALGASLCQECIVYAPHSIKFVGMNVRNELPWMSLYCFVPKPWVAAITVAALFAVFHRRMMPYKRGVMRLLGLREAQWAVSEREDAEEGLLMTVVDEKSTDNVSERRPDSL